jgi:hypothetical protein
MAKSAYSKRVNYDPPITLYRLPGFIECKAAFISKTPIAFVTIDCVAETNNTLYIRSHNGKEYARQKSGFPTFHTEAEAIEVAIAYLRRDRQELEEEAGTICEIIKYIEDSREA